MMSKIDSPELRATKEQLKARALDLQLAVILDKPERVAAVGDEIFDLVNYYLKLKGREVA